MSVIFQVLLPVLCFGPFQDGPAPAAVAEPEPHYTVRLLKDGPRSVRAMAFSPDGETLVASYGFDDTIFIRTRDGEVVRERRGTPFSLAFSKDGSRLLLVSERQTELLDAASLAAVPFAEEAEPGYTGLGIEARNGKLVVNQLSPSSPVARLGTIKPGDELVGVGEGRGGPMRSVIGMTFDTARQLIVGPAGTEVRLEIIPRGKTRPQEFTVERQAIRRSGTGYEFIAAARPGAGENLVWYMDERRHILRSAKSGQVVLAVSPREIEEFGQIALSPDGERFAVLARLREDGNRSAVEVYRVATGEREAFIPFPAENWYQLAFTPDGSKLLVGTWDTLEILDIGKEAPAGRLELAPKAAEEAGDRSEPIVTASPFAVADPVVPDDGPKGPRQLHRFAVSPRGIVAVGDPFGVVRLRDLDQGDLLYTFEGDPEDEQEIDQIEFSPDGKWLAYAVEGELHLVDVSGVRPANPAEGAAR